MTRLKLVFLIVAIIIISGCSVSSEDVKKYVKKTHGLEVDVIMEPSFGAKSSYGSSVVAKKDDPSLVFKVQLTNPFFPKITGDTYDEEKEFYELNQQYQSSQSAEKLRSIGFSSSRIENETFYSQSKKEIEKEFKLLLFKENGLDLQSDRKRLLEALVYIKEIDAFGKQNGYTLENIIVTDSLFKDYPNRFQYYQVSAGDFEIEIPYNQELQEVTNEDELMDVIFQHHFYGDLNAKSYTHIYYFRKDLPKFESTNESLYDLGFDTSQFPGREKSGIYLTCEDRDIEVETLEQRECTSYSLFLSKDVPDNKYKKLLQKDELNKWYEVIRLLQQSPLPIDELRVYMLDDSIYQIILDFYEIDNISSQEELKQAIEEQIEHLL